MRKWIAMLLALGMLVSMMAGCGSDPAASTQSAEPSAAPVSASASAKPSEPAADSSSELSAEASAAVAPQADFNIYGPFYDEPVTLTYWKLWPPFLEGFDPKEASLFATLRDALNVEIDVTTVGTDSAQTKFNLMVASGDYLDLIENAPSNYPGGGTKAIQDDVLVDLRPYMETYAPDYWAALQKDEIAMKSMINSDNQMASIVSLYDETPVPQSGLWARQDWLEAKGLDAPSTLEDMENVLQVFKDDYGCTDAYAVRDDCALPLRDVYGAYEWSLDADGNVVYGYTGLKDSFKDYLSKAHEWYEKGFFSSSFVTANDTTMPKSDMIVSGQSGMFDADILIVSEVGVLDSSVALTAVAPITKNADDKLPASWSSTMNSANSASVSTNCQHIKEAIAYMNYAFTDQAFMAVNWGTEGVTYTMENGKPVFTDLMLNNPNLPASFTPLAYISPGFPFLKSYEMTLSSYDYPAQKACYDIFASKIDDSLPKTSFPKDYLTFTTEESETVAQYSTDLDTYVTENLAKFITGDLDVEKDYDAFAAQLESMGCGEIQQVYQAAYDRFTA